MTATDELRKLLDERGVEWISDSENVTFWNTDADVAAASQGYDGMLWVSARLTPEQAIAATLGAGTCRNVDADQGWFECSECKCICSVDWYGSGFGTPKFCPHCGKKVENG